MNQLLQASITASVSGLLVLDNMQAGQLMFSRPFFAGFLLGLINGCPLEGAVMGLFFDLLYSSSLPMGGNIPPNGVAAVSASVLSFSMAGLSEPVSFFIGLLFAWVYSKADIYLRHLRSKWNLRCAEAIAGGLLPVYFWIIRSLLTEFLLMFALCFAASAFCALISVLPKINAIESGFQFAYCFVPAIGIAALYFRFKNYLISETPLAKDVACSAVKVPKKLRKIMKSAFYRSFLLQSCWNYARYQNFGFLFALKPFLRSVYKNKDALRKAMLRNFTKVNTQPVMASFLIGAVARLEGDFAKDKCTEIRLATIKNTIACSSASIGDRLFWARLMPISMQLGIFIWLLFGFTSWLFNFHIGSTNPSHLLLMSGPLFSIIFYCSFALPMRWKGLVYGFNGNEENLFGLACFSWEKKIRLLDITGLIFSIALVIEALAITLIKNHLLGTDTVSLALKFLPLLLIVLCCKFIIMRGYSLVSLLLSILITAVICAAAGVPVLKFCL